MLASLLLSVRTRRVDGPYFLPTEVVTQAVMGSVRAGHAGSRLLAFTRMAIPPSEPRKARPKGPVLKPRFVINLDDATAERLRRLAYRTKKSKNEIVRAALIAHLEENAR